MTSLGNAYFKLRGDLLSVYDEGEASAIAHMAMEHLTGLSRMQRLTQKEEVLTPAQGVDFDRITEQLMAGTPIQYIIGHTYFMGHRFKVSNAVLIPRPETEEMVQWITEEAARDESILDIGTGSGCIPVSLKLALPATTVHAIDISEHALGVAKANAEALGANVFFEQMDFLNEEASKGLGSFNVIVSNPPYIPQDEAGSLHANVRDYEPHTALFVPDNDPLLFYKAIAAFGHSHLLAGGSIYCELHKDYAVDTLNHFKASGYNEVSIRDDLQGLPRMLKARV